MFQSFIDERESEREKKKDRKQMSNWRYIFEYLRTSRLGIIILDFIFIPHFQILMNNQNVPGVFLCKLIAYLIRYSI